MAHIILFVMYIAEIGYLARRYGDPNLENEFNVAGFMANPAETLYQGLILAFKPVNMDVLPLYILLMVAFAPILWTMLRLPNLTLSTSFLLYWLRAISIGISPPSRRGPGISTRSVGSFFSYSVDGSRWVDRPKRGR